MNTKSIASSDSRFRLDGRIAVVTGGGAGIGRAIAHSLAGAGASVLVNDIIPETARQVAAEVREHNRSRMVAHSGDVASSEGAHDLIETAERQIGPVDILVNNAAAFVELKRFIDMNEEDWVAGMSSYYATLLCTNAVLPRMLSRGYGRIVNISSIGGDFGGVEMSVYSAAKGAIHALSRSIAKEVAGQGVTVNCVAPGTVETPRQRSRPEAIRREREARIPIGRFASPEEIAHATLFLTLKESAYITGEVLSVDGGRP